ncbi:MAG: glycosyltransferase family 39 protein, partial [Anaerolineae bacterium]
MTDNRTLRRIHFVLLLLVLGIAFGLRWRFIRTVNPYPDEFVTLLAMDMIRQKGVPVLPSGLFYEHGLLYSYLAAVASFLGDPLLWGRMVSLAFGLATITLTGLAGRRWFSTGAGLLAAAGLALAPAAIQWSGRVRMYALLQCLALLAVWLLVEGLRRDRPGLRWAAAGAYFAATLTQFAAVALLPPLVLAEMAVRHLRRERWYASPALWLRWGARGGAALVAFVVKRAGQPKGIAPLGAVNPAGGVWQVLQIYGSLSPDVGGSWAALAPFFLQPPALLFSLFAAGLLIVALASGVIRQRVVVSFLSLLLVITTVEMLFLVAPDRKDDKYLFMLLPVLFLLGAGGLAMLLERAGAHRNRPRALALAALFAVALGWYARGEIAALLSDVGEDYTAAFGHVAAHRQSGDAVLTGTPAAAYHYLRRNDYYAVQAGGPYDYRIL